MKLQKREAKEVRSYLSIEAYAEKAGVSKITIYNRIKAGDIIAEKNKELTGYSDTLIDIDKYPVDGFEKKKAGRKRLTKTKFTV